MSIVGCARLAVVSILVPAVGPVPGTWSGRVRSQSHPVLTRSYARNALAHSALKWHQSDAFQPKRIRIYNLGLERAIAIHLMKLGYESLADLRNGGIETRPKIDLAEKIETKSKNQHSKLNHIAPLFLIIAHCEFLVAE